jgi:minor extracellular serine protease Vpr
MIVRHAIRCSTGLGLVLLCSTAQASGPSLAPVAPVDPGLALAELRAGDGELTVFVQATDPAGAAAAIAASGGVVRSTVGDVLTARVPRAAVAELRAAHPIEHLEAAVGVRPRLDRAAVEIGVDRVHAGQGLARSHTGQGVIVGVIDIGIALDHPMFRNEDETSRVAMLWDQSADSGQPPDHYDYGAVCSAPQIDAGECPHLPEASHGTHVAGIAAGRGAAGSAYVGVAPDAHFVFVNLGVPAGVQDESEALTTAICDGAAWIFDYAQSQGLPAVINMSLGTHDGPHDGSSLANRCLDNLGGPGRIIVAAAGNEGNGTVHPVFGERVFVHGSGVPTPEAPVRLVWLPGFSGDAVFQIGSVWFDPDTDLSARIGVLDEDQLVFSDAFDVQQGLAPTVLMTSAGPVGPVAGAGGTLPDGPQGLQFAVMDDDADQLEAQTIFVLELAGSGRFDAFIDTTSGGGFVDTAEGGGTVDSSMTVGFPADSRSVIAVASYVTRDRWDNGGTHVQADPITGVPVELGALSGFSSRGPTRKPEQTGLKPDVAAPGELIASAFPAALSDEEDPTRVLPGGYLLLEGTSMASPVVTGIVALMLEVDPELDADAVRDVLDLTAKHPEGPGMVDAGWGRGKVDAWAASIAVGAGDDADTDTDTDGDGDGGTTGPTDAETDDAGAADDDAGCGCRSDGRRGRGWIPGLLALGALGRRRRPRS